MYSAPRSPQVQGWLNWPLPDYDVNIFRENLAPLKTLPLLVGEGVSRSALEVVANWPCPNSVLRRKISASQKHQKHEEVPKTKASNIFNCELATGNNLCVLSTLPSCCQFEYQTRPTRKYYIQVFPDSRIVLFKPLSFQPLSQKLRWYRSLPYVFSSNGIFPPVKSEATRLQLFF